MVLAGGSVKCWGHNEYGQLGYDSTDNKGDAAGEMANLGAVSLGSPALAIAAGWDHNCALLDGGSVKCWGRGGYGRLGYDSTDNKGDSAGEMASLATVYLGSPALAIAAGGQHTCALLDGGSVKCWGMNSFGQLGYDSTVNKGDDSGEMANLGTIYLGSPAIAISAGWYHTCALLVSGSIKCWGMNSHGQLGYDSTDNKGDAAGEMVNLGTVSLGSSAVAISVGSWHTCALLVGGNIKCWGWNEYGQLGYNSTDTKGVTAGEMAGLGTIYLGAIVTSIAAGGQHTCALLEGGRVKCWGDGSNGQLGYDSTDGKKSDAAGAVYLGSPAIFIAASWFHTCAILEGAKVKCWGHGSDGQLGYDSIDNKGDAAGEMASLGALAMVEAMVKSPPPPSPPPPVPPLSPPPLLRPLPPRPPFLVPENHDNHEDEAIPHVLMWALSILLPLCVLLVAVLVLLYRRHSRLSRNCTNAVISRDRAHVDLQLHLHVHQTQKAQTQPRQTDEQSSAESSGSLPTCSSFKGARPASLPPGPPSSAGDSVKLEPVKLEPVELEAVCNVSAVGGPRVPKSWCSRWLPTLPLSSEAPTSSAAPTSAPHCTDGVPSSPHPAEGPAGPTPAPPLSTLPVPPPKQQALPPPAPVPPAPAPLAKKGRLKGSAALRNAEMERALRLQWSALSESERAMLIAGAHSPAHVSQQ